MPVSVNQTPKYSVLLPTHNRADVFCFAIESVLAQTVQDFELLIVGDGCTDETAAVVNSYADPRICWFDLPKAPNFGYANRNIVLRKAKGIYIAFMAHDDLWLPDHLELLTHLLEETGSEWVYSRPLWVTPDGAIAPSTFNLNSAEIRNLFLDRKQNSIPAGCVLHRRDCFDKYGYWDEGLPSCGDWDMWARIIEGGNQQNFAYLEQPTCLHFRAIWRTEANAGPPELKVWQELHNSEDFMPSAMKVSVSPGVTEQETFWNDIKANPKDWSRELRVAVHQVLDQRVFQIDKLLQEVPEHKGYFNNNRKLVDSLILGNNEKMRALEEAYNNQSAVYEEAVGYARSLEVALKEQQVTVSGLQQELQSVYGSRAWQLASKLQQLYQWLRH